MPMVMVFSILKITCIRMSLLSNRFEEELYNFLKFYNINIWLTGKKVTFDLKAPMNSAGMRNVLVSLIDA